MNNIKQHKERYDKHGMLIDLIKLNEEVYAMDAYIKPEYALTPERIRTLLERESKWNLKLIWLKLTRQYK